MKREEGETVEPSKLALDSLYSTKISYCASTKSIFKGLPYRLVVLETWHTKKIQ